MGLPAGKLRARKFGGATRYLVMAGASLLYLLVLNTGAMTQTLQPKMKTSEQQPATPKQPAPGQSGARRAALAPAQPTWGATCPPAKGALDCRALIVQRVGNARISVAVRSASDTKKPNMLILLPLGLDLPAGVSLQFGPEVGKRVSFQSCDMSGCLAEYPVSEAEIAAMLKGADLTISVEGQNKQPITFQMSVAGFPEAYAKIR